MVVSTHMTSGSAHLSSYIIFPERLDGLLNSNLKTFTCLPSYRFRPSYVPHQMNPSRSCSIIMTLLFDSCSVCGATSSAYGDATTPQGTSKHNNFITVTMMVLMMVQKIYVMSGNKKIKEYRLFIKKMQGAY